ncbi:Sap-like sulfolipid-1-addressing protein [Streptomyces sp. 2132.2]|uniref:GAP family protein n=1 Tax=Streptomyces TaxID=1883 RepID=UPI000C1A0B89|nr:GAP family protein [Streptomyces sp. 2132.2]ROR00302.1 Sap-like sulfolipid-1-addressing protein [Streptomyces sp. 2132.2]
MVLDLLLIGLAITLEPIPVTAFILLLSAERGVRKGLVFILAWLACLVVVLALVVFATGGTPPPSRSAPSTAALAGKIAIGVGLIAYGEHKRRSLRRPRTRPPKPPAWAARLNEVSYWTAAGLAVLLQPWGLVAAGCATVVDADMSQATTVLTLFGFCLLATASLLCMELYATFAPRAAQDRLGRLRAWMEGHQDQTIVAISLLIGLWLVGKSIYQLTT